MRPAVLEPARLTVAEMLQQKGYATAALGKWHLGLNWVTTDGQPANAAGTNVDYSQPFTGGPINHGFDTYYGDDVINWPPYTMIRDNRTIGIPVGNASGQPYTPPGGVLPGFVTPGYTTATSLPLVLNETESYIAARASQPAPFFLYMPLTCAARTAPAATRTSRHYAERRLRRLHRHGRLGRWPRARCAGRPQRG